MKNIHASRAIIFVSSIVLLLILALFSFLPTLSQSPITLTNIDVQRMRSQLFAKNALLLQYGNAAQKTQALSEMQNSLPVFEIEETNILALLDADIHQLAVESQNDYSSLNTSVKALISSPNKVDPLEVNIILEHEWPYQVNLTSISSLAQSKLSDRITQILILIIIIATIELLLLISGEILSSKYRTKYTMAQQKSTIDEVFKRGET